MRKKAEHWAPRSLGKPITVAHLIRVLRKFDQKKQIAILVDRVRDRTPPQRVVEVYDTGNEIAVEVRHG